MTKLYTKPVSEPAVPSLLPHEEIAKRLRRLSGWRDQGKFLVKSFEFDEFIGGIEFVNKVAAVAEEEEHHPDIAVRYTTVTLSLQTHSEGGVTDWDLELAEAIEDMLKGGPKRSGKHR